MTCFVAILPGKRKRVVVKKSPAIDKLLILIHTFKMKNSRRAERFADFGRVENSEICVVSGMLEDISETGIRVSYSVPPAIDMDREYEVTVRLSRVSDEALSLIVRPVRIFISEKGQASVGFSILQSKDSARLENYIALLREDASNAKTRIVPQTSNESLFI